MIIKQIGRLDADAVDDCSPATPSMAVEQPAAIAVMDTEAVAIVFVRRTTCGPASAASHYAIKPSKQAVGSGLVSEPGSVGRGFCARDIGSARLGSVRSPLRFEPIFEGFRFVEDPPSTLDMARTPAVHTQLCQPTFAQSVALRSFLSVKIAAPRIAWQNTTW
jgi:hypothetical protein